MKTLRLYNTLTKQMYNITDFHEMTMYVCGPTLYAELHIGNGRSLVVFDVFYRLFKLLFNKVTFVRNITDIEDKIVTKSRERGISSAQLVKEYEAIFNEDLQYMNILPATFQPKATEFLPQIFQYIQVLMDKNYAYLTSNGNIYFSVSQLKNYDFFQNVNDLKEEARITNKKDKRNWKDFALWKSVKDDYGYESPWGYGRPGWHVECSAMSQYYLGNEFMLHGGGEDLAFPHHHNEIAQGMGYGNVCCSKIFIHNGLVCLNDQKMSKSIGNILNINTLVKNKYDGDVLRYIYLSTAYASNINFTNDILVNSQNNINRIREFKFKYIHLIDDGNKEVYIHHMLNNMNVPETITYLFQLMNDRENYNLVMNTWHLLGFDLSVRSDLSLEYIEHLLKQRRTARELGDYILSDEIRNQLQQHFVKVEDSKENQMWYYT